MEYLLPHLLMNSALRRPEKEAVRMSGAVLSYEQLDRVSNQVAETLRELGVRKGDRVAIYLGKSLASVCAVYGIMKCGGVYVPLDPRSPTKRLAYITRDCGIGVIVSSAAMKKACSELVAEGTPVKSIVLMEDDRESGGENVIGNARLVPWAEVASNRDGSVSPSGTIETDLAYILYTSGSTGTPKGVMISHRTILTFVNWCRDTFRVTCEDRVTSHAPLHFDLSTFDIYATTQAGGTMILVPEFLSSLPVEFVRLLQDESVTITYLVPSILSMMVNFGDLGRRDLSKLRMVLFAGEVFPMKYLRRLVAAIPHAEYFNLYGPTETNVCTYYKVRAEDLRQERGDRPVPIGKACENTEVFAVNDAGERIEEPGQEGELWVRGPCVAQGYWGDPEKSAAAFVRNPFQTMYPEVTYRTGDLVVLDENREDWLFVGRRDHMIKTRGYRVELGEVESVLYRHEDVKEAAVVAVADELLGSRIHAFVILAPGSGVTAEDLGRFCSEFVPRYMVPERIELRDHLPKTSSGKVDRVTLSGLGKAG